MDKREIVKALILAELARVSELLKEIPAASLSTRHYMEHQTENAAAVANAPTDIQDLLAEVRRLTDRLQYEETCHAEAQQEVKRLNRMVDKAVNRIQFVCCEFLVGNGCEQTRCAECWRKYLQEGEAD